MENRRSLPPFLPLALVWLVFAAYVWLTAGYLPERVATHFGMNGEPNGWETQAGYVRFTLIFGAVVPAFVLTIFALMRLGNGAGINIPHKDYWLAPERRGQTFAFIQRQVAWFAMLLIAFFAGMHYTILAANAHSPATLPPSGAIWLGGVFIVATIGWVVIFVGHFFCRPA